jgi:hypothetical protein
MKKDLINLVRILGIGYQEIMIDINLGFFLVDSIEFREPDDIILHHFDENSLDFELSFDDLENKDKKKIITIVNSLLYN